MTIKTVQFSQDKRITNDAMRLVRGCLPDIGPAYSDARENGRRYKFEQWGHKKYLNPGTVKELNKLFAEHNIRAKAYLHDGDGRGGYVPFWDGHLCIRTYDESNIKSNNNKTTTPIMKSKKNTTTSITANDITTVIAAALDQYLSSNQGKSTPASNSDEVFTFTGEELADFVRKVAVSVSEQCLDNVRAVTVDQDSAHTSLELVGNEIHMDVDMDGVADDLESSFEDIVDYLVEEDDNVLRWYESVKR